VGTVNVAVSIVAGMTLGIIVDDTVHFMSKYLRGRRERHSNGADAVRYAFSTVGMALVVTSIMLVAGFLILAQSSFSGNSVAGKLSAMTIAAALIADFFLFAPLLVVGDRFLGFGDQTSGEKPGN
jgi:predicted RND superfamily exporter protein